MLEDYFYSKTISGFCARQLDDVDVYDEAQGKTYKVYFAFDGQYVKIGYAKKPKSRIASIRTGNTNDVRILFVIHCANEDDAKALEAFLHALFVSNKVAREWFDIYDILVKERFYLEYDVLDWDYF